LGGTGGEKELETIEKHKQSGNQENASDLTRAKRSNLNGPAENGARTDKKKGLFRGT